MTIIAGLAIALSGAFAVACWVLALSNLYVGQWWLAGSLAVLGSIAGFVFFRRFDRFLVRTGADRDESEAAAPPPSMPLAPSLLSSFWLLALTVVLTVAAFNTPGTGRYLSFATALALLTASLGIFYFRPRAAHSQK